MRQAPQFEQMLVDDGITLSSSGSRCRRAEQRTRFPIRQIDPVRQWKLSPMDLASLDKWDDYTAAKEEMFSYTDTDSRRGRWSRATTRSAPGSRRCATCSAGSTTPTRTTTIVGTPDPLIVGRAKSLIGE